MSILKSLTIIALLGLGAPPLALSYSCEAEFSKAQKLLAEAEATMSAASDARVKSMLAEAKGLLAGAIVSQEIAAIIDAPVGTVMSRLARARRRLREIVQRYPEARQRREL